MLERKHLKDDTGKEIVRVLRDVIWVKENGAMVRYVRERDPVAKPKRKINKNRESNPENVSKDLPECRVVCHKMSEADILKKIEEIRGQSAQQVLPNPINNISIASTSNQQQLSRVETNFSWIQRADTLKIVIGNKTVFIASSVLRSYMLQLSLQLGLCQAVISPNVCDMFELNVLDEIDVLTDYFNNMSIAGQSNLQQLSRVQPNLSWIQRADTLKIVFGKNTYFIKPIALFSLLLQLGQCKTTMGAGRMIKFVNQNN